MKEFRFYSSLIYVRKFQVLCKCGSKTVPCPESLDTEGS